MTATSNPSAAVTQAKLWKVAAGADWRMLSVLELINPTILKSKHHAVLPTIRFLLLSIK